MWHPLALPKYPAPIRACSIPHYHDSVVIWTDEGVHRIGLLKNSVIVRVCAANKAESKFDAKDGGIRSGSSLYRMHGDCGSFGRKLWPQIQTEHKLGDTILVDKKKGTVTIQNAAGRELLAIQNVRTEDPCFIASFCNSFQIDRGERSYLIVCDSQKLHVYLFERDQAGTAAKWTAYAGKETKESLMKAILANPDDDAPRLIFADWLDENGDPERAEFIRLQCRIAERERNDYVPPDDPDGKAMTALEEKHAERWASEYGLFKGVHIVKPFYRGVPSILIYSPTSLLKAEKAKPLGEELSLESLKVNLLRAGDGKKLLTWPMLDRCRSLSIHCSMQQSIGYSHEFLQSVAMPGLRSIQFGGWFNPTLIQAVGKKLNGIETMKLDFLGAAIANDALEEIAHSTLPRLKTILVSSNDDSSETAYRLKVKSLGKSLKGRVVLVSWKDGQFRSAKRL
jgi:uncharacterized protein (TIGR02996 family)